MFPSQRLECQQLGSNLLLALAWHVRWQTDVHLTLTAPCKSAKLKLNGIAGVFKPPGGVAAKAHHLALQKVKTVSRRHLDKLSACIAWCGQWAAYYGFHVIYGQHCCASKQKQGTYKPLAAACLWR